MKKTGIKVIILILMVLLQSCENVFHNDKLDYMWKLDSLEYPDGVDLFGNICSKQSIDGAWFSFARDLVKVEDKRSGLCIIGILTDHGDQLTFDFSMYNDDNWQPIDDGLKQIGIKDKVTNFNVIELKRDKLVLENSKAIFRFTKW